MAEFDSLGAPIATSDRLGELLWSDAAQVETLKELYFTQNGMSYVRRKGDRDPHKRYPALPICLYEEFGAKAGSQISVPLRMNLTRTPRTATTGTYTYGSTSMLGNEEALDYYDLTFKIGLLKHAVGRDAPDYYDISTSLDLSADSEDNLKRWLVENSEEAMLDCLYDKFPYFIQQQLTVTAVAHPRIVWAGLTDGNQEGMSSGNTMTVREVLRMRSLCRNRKLNPIPIKGKATYVVLADTFVCADLQSDDKYSDLKDAMDRGMDNPIVTGAMGIVKGMAIHEYERMRVMTSGTNYANIGRAIVMGADALAVGYGTRPRLVKRKEDAYEDRWGLGIRQRWGAARADFLNQAESTTVQQSSAEWRVWRTAEQWAA